MVRFSRVRLAAVPMCHPQVIKSRQWMRHDGGNTLQYQGSYEGLKALPLKAMECGNSGNGNLMGRMGSDTVQGYHGPLQHTGCGEGGLYALYNADRARPVRGRDRSPVGPPRTTGLRS